MRNRLGLVTLSAAAQDSMAGTIRRCTVQRVARVTGLVVGLPQRPQSPRPMLSSECGVQCTRYV